MDIFNVISLLGGLAFFLFGMNILSSGLERMEGGNMERVIRRMTSNKLVGLVLGAGITIAIQSSSALTVMLVGLVNSGIMTAENTVGLILGSNIGTTLTAWLTSLTGIESDSVWMQMLKPANFSLVFAFIGAIMLMFCKRQKQRNIGEILIGFGVLMYGMKIMGDAMKPLQDMPEFTQILTAFNNPLLGVLVGTAFTGLIQSSAASVAILQALAMTGSITWAMALPIVMGQNIGTCVTALLSAIGVNREAKRVPAIHFFVNIFGTIVFLILVYGSDAIFHFSMMDQPIDPAGIALAHTAFNVVNTLILLPLSNQMMWVVNKCVPVKAVEPEFTPLDDHLLTMPSAAVSESMQLTYHMAEVAQDCLRDALSLMDNYDDEVAARVEEGESKLDEMEDQLGSFLVKLSAKNLSNEDSLKVSLMLHAIGDFERIGDHALNLLASFQEIKTKQLSFSEDAKKEIGMLRTAIQDILGMSVDSFLNWNVELAQHIEPLEQVVDDLTDTIKARHINRLREGQCSIEMGFILSDVLGNFERISDHCSNIGIAVIELKHSTFDTHEHLRQMKTLGDEGFKETYELYVNKYKV